jgi:hypothetical protein
MTPTTSVSPLVEPSSPSRCQSCSKKLPSSFSTPKSFGNCPTMIVRARPMMNPFITGSEMKLARKPRRSSPATSAAIPTVSAIVIVSWTKRSSSWPARSPTAAADSAAVAAIGPTTRWRELPKAA